MKRRAMRRLSKVASILCLIALGGCDTLGDWLGDDTPDQPPLPGDRISVLSYDSDLRADSLEADKSVRMMQPQVNQDFPFETALQQQGIENLKIESVRQTASVSVGEGNDWETELVQQPVIADGRLFAMDGYAVVSAHDVNDISRVLWTAETAFREEDEEVTGGGLAYSNGVLYLTTGYGAVLALVAEDGSLLWRQETDVPIRAAPAVADGKVFVVTIDNQLQSFDARTGQPLWAHRGIKESAVYLGTVTPVIENGIVIASYSSGELFAIRAEDGTPLWSDTLIANRRTSASAVLTGIDATPVIRDNIVYAISNNGLMVANLLTNGRGLWDLDLAGYHTPWIAGEYLFVLDADSRLVAVHRRDKTIKWITDLRSKMDVDDNDPLPRFTAPIMMNNQLVLLHDEGEMLLFFPDNGELAEQVDIPDGVRITPIAAGGKLYLIDDDATLYQYQ